MGWLALGLAVVAGVAVVLLYNALVRARVRVREAWAQVEVQLQRRYDLVPPLAAAAAAAMRHERGVLTGVTDARAEAMRAHAPADRDRAEEQLSAAVSQLLARVEDHPELRSDATVRVLLEELRDAEDRLAFARDFANHRVERYRTLATTVPGVLVARPLGFGREPLFAVGPEVGEPTAVDLGRGTRRPDGSGR